MAEDRKPVSPTATTDALRQVSHSAAAKGGDEPYQLLRQIGGRAWQLQAAIRAADHYIAQDAAAERNTGSWLVACAVDLAEEVAAELDGLARTLKDRPADASVPGSLQKLRTRSYKLQASARAADHFLDQDTGEDRSTASWLVACALDLAEKLAASIEDEASQLKRAGGDTPATFSEAVAGRKPAVHLRNSVA